MDNIFFTGIDNPRAVDKSPQSQGGMNTFFNQGTGYMYTTIVTNVFNVKHLDMSIQNNICHCINHPLHCGYDLDRRNTLITQCNTFLLQS